MQIKNMNMELPYAYEKPINNVHVLHHGNSSSRLFVIIRHSESRTLLKTLAQASLLALLIMILAGVFGGSTNRETNNNNNNNNFVLPNTNNYLKLITSHHENVALMSISSILPPLIFQDLANEGLLTIKDKTLIVVDNTKAEQVLGFTVSPSNKKQQDSIRNQTFTFTFTNCYNGAMEGFVDRTLKTGGVMVVQLRRDPSVTSFQVPPNYKIVYFRKLNNNSTFIAMRKLSSSSSSSLSSSSSSSSSSWRSRRLLQFLSEEKKAILGNLEDVLLEPPRSATGKSKTYLRKTKFLPDLLNDSLEGYSRRVYIDVGGTGHGSTRWFEQNYPTRNKDFDMYRIETVPETEVESDDAWEGPPTQMGISDWLWRNVKAEEYVVMKADAEVVEEMLKSKAIALVDELFLECKPFGKGGNNKRAYWECLALYGRLRDFGVAVHQWWG